MCFFHKWTKWETYTWQGYCTPRWGKMAGKTYQLSELRQRRKCKKCGKTQDELIN